MRRFMILSVATAVAVLVSSVSAEACCLRGRRCCHTHTCCDSGCHDHCGGCGYGCGAAGCCGYRNEYVTEKRMVNVVEYARQEQTRTVKVHVPTWVDEERTVQVVERVPVTKTVNVKRHVWNWEEVQGTRVECRCVPVTETRTVSVNTGHWATEMVEVGCGGCGCHRHCGSCCNNGCGGCGGCGDACGATRTVCRRVWVPGCEQREVTFTHHKLERVEVPYTAKVRKCSVVEEPVQVTSCECQTVSKTVKVRVCRHDVQERQETFTVCVPQTVQKEIEVTVCRRVPVVGDACGCGQACGGHCGHCGCGHHCGGCCN